MDISALRKKLIQQNRQHMDFKTLPNEWFCPISQEVMTDPVICADGYTYERKVIEEWLAKNASSPVTRQPLDSKGLIPNMALKSTIEKMLPEYKKNGALLHKPEGAKLAEDLAIKADTLINGDELLVNVSIIPPQAVNISKRKKVAIICVLDVSGSMDTEAKMADSNDENGFTRLDLVKHSVNTVIHSLGEGDLVALVPFSSSAKIALNLTEMDKKGQTRAENELKKMNADGSTNIWDGLRVGLDLSKDERCNDKNVFIVLLTDGEPNINPPQGIVPTLRKYVDAAGGLCSNLHVFGYGYNLDTVLLTQIAQVGLGTYGYIPDCSMVGTIFVNFLSNALSSVTNLAQLTVRPQEGMTLKGTYGYAEPQFVAQLGAVQYGQNRDLLYRFSLPQIEGGKICEITLNYGFGLRKQTTVVVSHSPTGDNNYMQRQLNRAYHIEGLGQALKNANNLDAATEIVKNTLLRLKSSPIAETDELTKLYIRDIESQNENEGQVSKAFQKQEWYTKWGKHYIPALMLAHTLQVSTNFKDPGLQKYGGLLFEALKNTIDTIFINLPPPAPTVKKANYVAPSSMARYYNYGGGCIHPDCKATMADGSVKNMGALKKGDVVKTPKGESIVKCVLKTKVNGVAKMVHLPGGLIITPYHPVKVNGEWKFPIDISEEKAMFVQQYVNFVLENEHVMIINGVECVGLGHGLKDNKTIEHPYLGSSKVIDDLEKMEGWEQGEIFVGHFERHPVTQMITKILSQPAMV